MKIEVNINENIPELNIQINSPNLTPEIEKIISMIRIMDMQIPAVSEGETVLVDVADILYIEAVERTSFLYTEKQVYESNFKLYELEQQLSEKNFFKASKSCLIQLKKIKSLKADINRKIRVTMCNGEQIMVSRMYADELRKRLGIK